MLLPTSGQQILFGCRGYRSLGPTVERPCACRRKVEHSLEVPRPYPSVAARLPGSAGPCCSVARECRLEVPRSYSSVAARLPGSAGPCCNGAREYRLEVPRPYSSVAARLPGSAGPCCSGCPPAAVLRPSGRAVVSAPRSLRWRLRWCVPAAVRWSTAWKCRGRTRL